MPYRDKELKRAYQRRWVANKRAGKGSRAEGWLASLWQCIRGLERSSGQAREVVRKLLPEVRRRVRGEGLQTILEVTERVRMLERCVEEVESALGRMQRASERVETMVQERYPDGKPDKADR